MKNHETDDRLSDWLRAGDPAGDGCEPTVAETAAMRRRVLDSRPENPHLSLRISPVWALAAALLLAVALGRGFAPGVVGPAGVVSPAVTPARPAAQAPAQRQIQFDTPGGTRVVWVLDTEFEV